MRRLIKGLFSRTTVTILFVLIELALMAVLAYGIGRSAAWVAVVLRIAGVFVLIYITTHTKHLSFDIIWIIGIVVLPVSVTSLYLILCTPLFKTNTYKSIVAGEKEMWKYLGSDEDVLEELYRKDPAMRGQFRYISEGSGYPFYRNEGMEYYGFGENGFPAMLEELEKAERFIFIEYFIIEKGKMWTSILDILERKAAEGVEVRIIYDDMGSFSTLPVGYKKEMAQKNIKCEAFNRISPILAKIMNHRDHRKIMVIDGRTAFSGGINLADNYINEKQKYGVWKDNVIMVKGKAVWSYTVMFLSHWNAVRPDDKEDYNVFRADEADEAAPETKYDGYIAPYGETPLDDEITSQNIYMNILNQANDYVYIFTPYLIIDSELENAIVLASKRGVDVRLITPGIPDKKRIWRVTRSYYQNLLMGGVKIYEYRPGFVHAKVFVSDDRVATVGTINLDYRSLYLHFENGTYIYDSEKVYEIKEDFLKTNEECIPVTIRDIRQSGFADFRVAVLRMFAPLL